MAGSPDPRRPRLAVAALGCRVSQAEMDALAAAVEGRFEVVPPGEPADLVVLNTCTITADADASARRAIRRAAREHPGARIVVSGCAAALRREALASLPGVAALVGARDVGTLPEVLARLAAGGGRRRPGAAFAPDPDRARRHARPALKVQDGCDAACSYCTVPLARGPARSLPLEEAVGRLVAAGARHRELVLTGVHLGAYGRDLAPRRTLADLVRAAVAGGLAARLRLSSVEPDAFPVGLLDDDAGRSALCPHFHLPLQSGAPRVLAAMRRPYRPAAAREVVERIAARAPGACLGADLITGFPGETDADHRETVALVEALPFAYLHVFPFSPRPGTPAAGMGGRPPPAVARERGAELRALSARRWHAFLAARVGRELEVVVERVEAGEARGTSGEFVPVRWPSRGEARGDLVAVRVRSAGAEGCAGEAR